MASLTVAMEVASSSGISVSNSSSIAMINSTVSRESAPRSSMKEASGTTLSASTPSCSTMMSLTFCSISADMKRAVPCVRETKAGEGAKAEAPAMRAREMMDLNMVELILLKGVMLELCAECCN